jgi:hypothetical protein
LWRLLRRNVVPINRATGFRLVTSGSVNRKVENCWGLTGDSTFISTLLPLALSLSFDCSFIRFLNNQPRGVRESLPEFGSFRGSNFVLSVDGVLDEECFATVADEDEEDDGDILDSGDLPGLLGRGAAIIPSVTGESGAGLALTLTGEEGPAYDTQ